METNKLYVVFYETFNSAGYGEAIKILLIQAKNIKEVKETAELIMKSRKDALYTHIDDTQIKEIKQEDIITFSDAIREYKESQR